MATDYAKTIWDYFLVCIGNEYGVAALMGNLQAESGLCPYRLQGDFTTGYTESIAYTEAVDSGAVSEYDFVNNGPNGGGYGLAQWTYPPRKQALYTRWKTGGYSSIGDISLACSYLWYELQTDYRGVLSVLQTATDIRTPSNKVLHDFENPADQSVSVEEYRASLGAQYYNQYATGEPITPGNPDNPRVKKKLPLWLLYAATRRRV